MKIGDLVMWTGKDEHHAMIGVLTSITASDGWKSYNVLWADGTRGIELYESEIMAVVDDPKV
jgi:hypothetical protein